MWSQSHNQHMMEMTLEINTSKHRPSPAFQKLKHMWIIRDTLTGDAASLQIFSFEHFSFVQVIRLG